MINDCSLQWKFAAGLGDVIAIFLHTGLMGKFVHKVLKLKAPCEKCQMRRQALNILFPIPFWRLFFKTHEDYRKALVDCLLQQFPDHVEIEDKQGTNIIPSQPLYVFEHILNSPNTSKPIKCIFSVWTSEQKEILDAAIPDIIYFNEHPGTWITLKFET